MPRTEATLTQLIEGLCAAVAFEIQPLDPKVIWKHLNGLGLVATGGDSLPAPDLISIPSRVPKFFDRISEILAVDPDAGVDDWLNSDAPLTCGAVHDLLDHILSEVPSSQWRGHGREWWDYSAVLRHVADTGEPIAQARARVARASQGLRLVA